MREVSKYTLHKEDKQKDEELRRILESIDALAKMSAETTKAVMALANKQPEKLDMQALASAISRSSTVDVSGLAKPIADAIKSKEKELRAISDSHIKAISSMKASGFGAQGSEDKKPVAYKFVFHRNSANLITSAEAIPQ